MKVVIVEDDPNKSAQILTVVKEVLSGSEIVERRSYQSGLKEIVHVGADLVVLDMSMPTFDVTHKDKGGRTRAYAGRDVLDEIKRRSLETFVIIVTQFETFGEGSEQKSLEQLKEELELQFPGLYGGAVYYHPAQSDWRGEITCLLEKGRLRD